MASLEVQQKNSKGVGGRRSKKLSTKVDLTPMVDLGFLLITFFIFTTTLAKPKVMSVSMPYNPPDQVIESTPWSVKTTTTILLSGDHQLYYYTGDASSEESKTSLRKTDFKGIRTVILNRKKQVANLVARGEIRPKEAAFLIKADRKSTYEDFVRILDEMNINDVHMKAVVDITSQDDNLINNAKLSRISDAPAAKH